MTKEHCCNMSQGGHGCPCYGYTAYERGRIAGLREAGQICLDRASGCHAVVAADAEGQLEGAYEDILALIPDAQEGYE